MLMTEVSSFYPDHPPLYRSQGAGRNARCMLKHGVPDKDIRVSLTTSAPSSKLVSAPRLNPLVRIADLTGQSVPIFRACGVFSLE
jgi:hypothetical protein